MLALELVLQRTRRFRGAKLVPEELQRLDSVGNLARSGLHVAVAIRRDATSRPASAGSISRQSGMRSPGVPAAGLPLACSGVRSACQPLVGRTWWSLGSVPLQYVARTRSINALVLAAERPVEGELPLPSSSATTVDISGCWMDRGLVNSTTSIPAAVSTTTGPSPKVEKRTMPASPVISISSTARNALKFHWPTPCTPESVWKHMDTVSSVS